MGSARSIGNKIRFSRSEIKSPPPRSIRPDRKKRYILPTKQGLLFLLVIGGLLIGSMNYNNNLGFLLAFLLGSMAFVSMIHTYKNLSGIHLSSIRSTPVFSGEKAVFEIIVTVDDEKPAVEFAFPHMEKTGGDLSPNRENRFIIKRETEKRGILHPGILVVSTCYPLGLFRAWSRIESDASCLIYPRPISGPYTPTEIDRPDHENGNFAGPGSEDFQGLRAYQAGDSFQRIDWKSFSRGMGLYTKSFSGKTGSTILLDWQGIKGADLEYKLSRLCDMVLKADGSPQAYGLHLPGEKIHPGKGTVHKRRCLKTLALYGPAGNRPS